MIRFILPSTDTPWQKAEELGLKDKLAMKVGTVMIVMMVAMKMGAVMTVMIVMKVGSDLSCCRKRKTKIQAWKSPGGHEKSL